MKREIEYLRNRLYALYEASADEAEILAVSRALDRLIIRMLRAEDDTPPDDAGSP